MYSPSIQKLIDIFGKFPTVGQRTAARFVFYLIKLKKEEIDEFTAAILMIEKKVKFCSFCFKPFESFDAIQDNPSDELCEICQNPQRDKSLLCVVEKETDVMPIEKTQKYKGRYFVLGGTVSKLRKEDMDKLRTNELKERIKNSPIEEIIVATDQTTEGEATALYLERVLNPLNIKITRLGRGLPVGGELEYADKETLGSALESRK